jgi:hypothetical protein
MGTPCVCGPSRSPFKGAPDIFDAKSQIGKIKTKKGTPRVSPEELGPFQERRKEQVKKRKEELKTQLCLNYKLELAKTWLDFE